MSRGSRSRCAPTCWSLPACRCLTGPSRRWAADANPMTAEQALAVIGLYLRGRRQYPMIAPNGLRFGEHLLLWSAARAQLPSGWRWGSALVAHSRDVQRNGPTFLFGSLHERIVRLLRCRDRVHTALLVPQDNQTAGEATEALDYFMVNLVGAFDAAARAAHLAAGLDPGSRRNAAWQKDGWRRQIRAASPELADLFAAGTTHSRVLEIARILRNTVHGEGLHTTAAQHGGRPRETLVALPEDDAQDLAGPVRPPRRPGRVGPARARAVETAHRPGPPNRAPPATGPAGARRCPPAHAGRTPQRRHPRCPLDGTAGRHELRPGNPRPRIAASGPASPGGLTLTTPALADLQQMRTYTGSAVIATRTPEAR